MRNDDFGRPSRRNWNKQMNRDVPEVTYCSVKDTNKLFVYDNRKGRDGTKPIASILKLAGGQLNITRDGNVLAKPKSLKEALIICRNYLPD